MKSCPRCTLENNDDALQCSACTTLLVASGESNGSVCPTCTFVNHNMASRCNICETELNAEQEWSCLACCQTVEQLEVAGMRVLWLPCAHRACAECHKQWIRRQDDEGKEPTCLTCEASGSEAIRLDDVSIKQILGDDCHAVRAERLMIRAGLLSCPTPDCDYMVALEEGLSSRRTTCPRCRKVVVVGVSRVDAPVHEPAVAATVTTRAVAVAAPTAACQTALAGSGSADDPHRLDETSSAGKSEEDSEEDEPLAQVAERRQKRKRDEEASAATLRQFRTCPGCRQGLEKVARSCNKFQCRCGCRFCWKCGALADAAGNLACGCTGRDHVFWDNVRDEADDKPRLQWARRR